MEVLIVYQAKLGHLALTIYMASIYVRAEKFEQQSRDFDQSTAKSRTSSLYVGSYI